MEEEAKSKVTRRDFLKDVGAGAIGTALISAGVLNPQAVEGAQAAAATPVLIPSHVGERHKKKLRDLMVAIRDDPVLKSAGVLHVNLRLNESETEDKNPVFIDWVGTPDVNKILDTQGVPSDPGAGRRFGQTLGSKVYDDGVGKTPQIVDRDWSEPGRLKEKTKDSQLLGPRVGAMYQMFIGIIAAEQGGQRRCVGLLTAGFPKKLQGSTKSQVEQRMQELASWSPNPKSPLTKLIEESFILGGPILL